MCRPLPFQPCLSVLDYSLPLLLFQSVSSSFLPLIFVLPSSASFPVNADLMLLPELQHVSGFPESQILIDERAAQVCICSSLPVFAECPVRLCLSFLATDHVHGVLALGQRGQLGLGVVQAHSLPQGPKVTWVALLSTKTNTETIKRHEKPAGFSSAAGKANNSNSNTEILYTKVTPFCSVWCISTQKNCSLAIIFVHVKG